jgi:RNA polymerase sigma-70 factor, ECF subfamily
LLNLIGPATLPDMGEVPRPDELLVRTLYADHGPALLGYAYRLTSGDRQRAEDIVQETILRAWQHPQAFSPERQGAVRAWLFTVARNLAIDGARARSARPREVEDPEGWEPSVIDDELDRVLTRMEVSEALEALSAQHREVIREIYFADRSVAQASAELGVPVGTIKSRCYYALRSLRDLCEERGILR